MVCVVGCKSQAVAGKPIYRVLCHTQPERFNPYRCCVVLGLTALIFMLLRLRGAAKPETFRQIGECL